jgi:hypothetical protein
LILVYSATDMFGAGAAGNKSLTDRGRVLILIYSATDIFGAGAADLAGTSR